MMSTPALVLALAGMIPLMAITIHTDLKTLKIPNWVVLSVLALFLATGSWGLPFDVFLWRLFYGVIVLGLGIALYAVGSGKVGAGDLKLIATLTPFINPPDISFVLLLYCFVTIIGLIGHRMIRAKLHGRETGWKAVDQKIYFPLGLILGVVIVIYLLRSLVVQIG